MISIISRKYGKNDLCMLSVRVKNATINNATALGISVPPARWESINQTIKGARAAHRRGTTIFIDDALTSKLWELCKTLSIQDKAGTLTRQAVTNAVRSILHKDEQEEAARGTLNKFAKAKVRNDKPSLHAFIEQYLQDLESGARLKFNSNKKVAPDTPRIFKACLHCMENYENDRHLVLDWDDMTLDFYEDWRTWMLDRMLSPNSIALYSKVLKAMLNRAADMKYTTTDDFRSSRWSTRGEEADNIYIPTSRIQELYSLSITRESLSSLLKAVPSGTITKEQRDKITKFLREKEHVAWYADARDIFVVGCLTGQRISDYSRISSDMLVSMKGREFIQLTQKKTDKEIYIPASPAVREIIERHGGHLPKMNAQKLITLVRELALMLGWTEKVDITKSRGLLRYDAGLRFFECIKTHTARRSFATNAYKAGVPLSAIMAVTGHSTEMMLRRYLKLDNKERAVLAAIEFDKHSMAL